MFWNIEFSLNNIQFNNDIILIDKYTLKLFFNDKDYITFNLNSADIWCSTLNVGTDEESVEYNLNYIKKIKNKLIKYNIKPICTIKQ
jgi:hypothetical protein